MADNRESVRTSIELELKYLKTTKYIKMYNKCTAHKNERKTIKLYIF